MMARFVEGPTRVAIEVWKQTQNAARHDLERARDTTKGFVAHWAVCKPRVITSTRSSTALVGRSRKNQGRGQRGFTGRLT
jgi:hypothetical protein